MRSIPVGFQLYTVRAEFARNVPHTLGTIAKLGYKGVEFWGYEGTANVYKDYSAGQLRKLLDDNGLQCCGIHVELAALAPENVGRTLENCRVLGSPALNLASAKTKMSSNSGVQELAELLNDAARKCSRFGMKAGYHAHNFDFVRMGGHSAWELLFRQTRPEVNMQMDVANCLAGGGDPIRMFKEFPGRSQSIHLREHEEKTFDSPYYGEVFRLAESSPGLEWYIVEMGGPEGNGFEVPQGALERLRQAGRA